ncbi:MAG: FecR domain-containing protein [Sedimentisphaerales bacterium]
MSCGEYKDLIEKYLDGAIAEDELSKLQAHIEACPLCRADFERGTFVENAVKQAFSSHTSVEQAGASLVARLSEQPNRKLCVHRPVILSGGRRIAVAAGIVLAFGLVLGFALGRAGEPTEAPLKAEVPIRVAHIEGIVLVKHEGSNLWQVPDTSSKVHLGDTFHSAAKSVCRLKFEDKSSLELDQNSMLVLQSYDGGTQFYLEHGKLDAALESPHPPFFISTPDGRVEALGTEFTVTVVDE